MIGPVTAAAVHRDGHGAMNYTVPTQRTVNLILMLRTICKMSGSLFDCWSDLISDKYVS